MPSMATPSAKKGRTVLISSDPCPRNCNSGPNTVTHLLSDHSDIERVRQCTKCACVIQDVHPVGPSS